MDYKFGQNPWGITNDEGRELSPAYIKAYIRSYCRGDRYSYNRDANIAYFSTSPFLTAFFGFKISVICNVVKTHPRWTAPAAASMATTIARPTVFPVPAAPTTTKAPRPICVTVARKIAANFLAANSHNLDLSMEFVLDFAAQIAADYGITCPMLTCNRGYSFHRFMFGGRHEIRFSYKSVAWIINNNFNEYKTVQYVIRGLNTNGAHGLMLLVLHEVAHAVDCARNGRQRGECHGRDFQNTYAELIKLYWIA